MSRTCKQCRRVNPREAAYCYRDGTPLDGQGDSSAIDAGSRPFTNPFVLPSGRSCRNFNQLAVACHEDPSGAVGVLTKGHLATFLGAQGRTDLADAAELAAHTAAQTHNGARALDEFLNRLPAPALRPASLQVDPTAIDLGTLQPGQSRRVELVLHNRGMRLLYGSASCEGCTWLSLGDGPERQRFLFQFSDRSLLPVRVIGRQLRAFRDPQEAQVLIESNGGPVTVTVRVCVPVRPFPDGVLAGAASPRELASKAKHAPAEAAVVIESGAVARWYESNGWTYPVAGPTAKGQAAVQQLFEALGLVKPPHVELGEESVELHGIPGQKFEYVLAVVTQEPRAVVAHAASDQPWLQIGPTVFRGRSAFLPLNVPAVPARPGETLHARVEVTANGSQHFNVPVTLVIGGQPTVVAPASRPVASVPARSGAAAVPVARPAVPPPSWGKTAPQRRWVTLLPAGLLALLLVCLAVRDLLAPAVAPTKPPPQSDPVPRVDIRFHDSRRDDELEKRWLTDPSPTMRFGLVTLYKGKEVGSGANVNRLTFDPWGRTNNTCLRFDGTDERLFGSARGRWEDSEAKGWKDDHGQAHDGTRSLWICDDLHIEVTQRVELVRGQASGLLDTAQVHYEIENKDMRDHTVGLRFLLDTFIGGNDGVPFTIPGDSDLCDTLKELSDTKEKPLPDFLQALETADLAHPGTIAHLRLRLDDMAEIPERVTLGAWPNDKLRVLDRKALGPSTLWDVPFLSMKSLGLNDSAVAMYWKEQPLKPGARREIGFEYGFWKLASAGSALGVTVDGVFRPGKTLTVVAYVNSVGLTGDETATLVLPDGFKVLSGSPTQPVPKAAADVRGGNRPITWRVEAGSVGQYEFTVKTSTGVAQSVPVEIKQEIFQ